MEITCLQMDVLLSFYIEKELSEVLRAKVEEHLKICPTCRAKYNIISSLFSDLKTVRKSDKKNKELYSTNAHSAKQYQLFRNNLSAYIDNELPEEESVKMKKYTITNNKARKDLEDSYQIRKLMRDSFKKTQTEHNQDLSKNILKNLNHEYKNMLNFNPIITVAFAFIMSVILISTIVIYMLSL